MRSIFFVLAVLSTQQCLAAESPKTWTVYATSYNPIFAQTDDSPCVGASGVNQCELAEQGIRILALSRELVGRANWKPFHYGDRVRMTSDVEQCNGVFLVLDTMSSRFRNRADIFYLDRADNTSCTATISKL